MGSFGEVFGEFGVFEGFFQGFEVLEMVLCLGFWILGMLSQCPWMARSLTLWVKETKAGRGAEGS